MLQPITQPCESDLKILQSGKYCPIEPNGIPYIPLLMDKAMNRESAAIWLCVYTRLFWVDELVRKLLYGFPKDNKCKRPLSRKGNHSLLGGQNYE